MKLHEAATLGHNAATKRAMELLKAVKPEATLEDLAWYCAYQEGQTVSESFNRKDMAWLFYDGVEALKDNPKKLESYLEGEFEWQDDEYGEDETNKHLTSRFKEFF